MAGVYVLDHVRRAWVIVCGGGSTPGCMRHPDDRCGAGQVDDRCNIENITEGLRVIADGPILCQAVSGAFV